MFARHEAASPKQETNASPAEIFKDRAETLGIEKAYQSFISDYADKEFSIQHPAMHEVGRALYQVAGLPGFGVCDASFAFGCYHSFLAQAIAENGLSIVPDLAEACRKKYGAGNETGCTHGIGHGVVEYLGSNNLAEALELCSKTGQTNPLFGCTSGAFMEYNQPTTFEGGVAYSNLRKPGDDLLAPCDSLSTEDWRSSCFFEIPLWWKGTIKDDVKIGNLCLKAEGARERESCFMGWGTIVAENSSYSVEKAGSICGLIKDVKGASECRFGIAMRWDADGKHSREGREICRGGDKEIEKKCLDIVPQ
jgi:hypothetical protein